MGKTLAGLTLEELGDRMAGVQPGSLTHGQLMSELSRRQLEEQIKATIAQCKAAEAAVEAAKHTQRNAPYMLCSVVVLTASAVISAGLMGPTDIQSAASERQALGKCEAEAQRTYPNEDYYSIVGTLGVGSPMIRYVHSCMLAAGFEPRLTKVCVDESHPGMDSVTNPHCYAPIGWLDFLIYRVEFWRSARMPE